MSHYGSSTSPASKLPELRFQRVAFGLVLIVAQVPQDVRHDSRTLHQKLLTSDDLGCTSNSMQYTKKYNKNILFTAVHYISLYYTPTLLDISVPFKTADWKIDQLLTINQLQLLFVEAVDHCYPTAPAIGLDTSMISPKEQALRGTLPC